MVAVLGGHAVAAIVVFGGRWISGFSFVDVRGSCTRRLHSFILLMVVVMVMVMQGASRQRVYRRHPELVWQPVGAQVHVRSVSAKA